MAIPKKNQLVGLDIGSHSVKLVEIDHSKKGMILKSFGMIGLPSGAIVEGSVREPDVVASAIRTLCKNLKVRNRNVATSISGYSVIVKKIEVGEGEEGELEKTIHEEAEQYIPFDINDVNLDYELLPTPEEPSEEEKGSKANYKELILVAAKKDMVNEYVALLEMAGLSAMVMDVDAFALQNAFEISASEPQGCYALVTIGAEELGINAIKGGISMFTRDSSYGGKQITEGIMNELKISFEEAEKIKLGGTKLDDKEKGVLEEIFTSVVTSWVQEIKRALDFLSTTYPDATIEKVYVAGGSCRIPGFQKYLELDTGIPVEEINPFANLIINEKTFDPKYLGYAAPQAAVAVGLALRSIDDK